MAAIATVAQITTTAPFGGGRECTWVRPWFPESHREDNLDADTQRVERCLGGEEAAWEDMVKVHTRRVYGLCFRFTGSDAEAQDLTQEVFLRVFRSLKTFRAPRYAD